MNITAAQLRAMGVRVPRDTVRDGLAALDKPASVRFTVPIRTTTRKNESRHWRHRHCETKAQRATVAFELLCHRPLPALPVVVKLTRYGKRLLDDDNLTGALSACRDEIAEAYGCGDGPRDPLTWEYAQKVGDYAVGVQIRTVTR